MTKVELVNKVTRTFGRVGLKIRKHSPEILVVTGIASGVAATVMACKATTKLESVMAKHKEEVEKIHGYVEENGYSEKYTEEDSKKDLAIVYTQTGIKLAKMYAPAVTLGVLSVTCVLSGNNILRKRNAALAVAYTAVDKSFKEYRGRVVERFGEELDKELRYNIRTREVETVVVDENGETKVEKETVIDADMPQYSVFARVFDDGNVGWTKDPEYNRMYIHRVQDAMNKKLQERGHLFLNEVYDEFGFDRTQMGQRYGWIYDKNHPTGDNYVDFGVFDLHDKEKVAFINGKERTIILDFNVDGDILSMI